MAKIISVSIGVFAHNEELNISKVLNSIVKQKTEVAEIKEVLVISSGSWDKTNRIVKEFSKKNKKIQLIEQLERRGKSSAINIFLRKAKGKAIVIVSSDLRLRSNTIEELSIPFLHRNVGMVGGHPKPANAAYSQIGSEGKLLWQLHHLVSLHKPKCGEIVAFRNVINQIPKESAVDEATIEVLLKLIGFKVVYAPRAIVYNKLPRTIKDFLVQRRRIFAGHLWVGEKYNYQVSTMGVRNNWQALTEYFIRNPVEILTLIKLLSLELLGRSLGWIDYHILGKNPYVWKMVKR